MRTELLSLSIFSTVLANVHQVHKRYLIGSYAPRIHPVCVAQSMKLSWHGMAWHGMAWHGVAWGNMLHSNRTHGPGPCHADCDG